MAELSKAEIQALGRSVNLTMTEPELTEISYHVNALLEAMESIGEPDLEKMEHIPVLFPPEVSKTKRL